MSSSKKFYATDYWDQRYKKGGNSGAGSYGKYAQFKADTLNEIINEFSCRSMIELGCGDGNQLGLLRIKKYLGLDVSKEAISICIDKYKSDKHKSFCLYDPNYYYNNTFTFDISVSLEVIFHIIDDSIYRKYLDDLFFSSHNLVVLYSSNYDEYKGPISHVKHRVFTRYIDHRFKEWSLIKIKKNKFVDRSSDFYIYRKRSY